MSVAIYYYKLDESKHYNSNDKTLNCGLTGPQIDGNFNFLSGNDIKTAYLSGSTLALERFTGEILPVDLSDLSCDCRNLVSGICSGDTLYLYFDDGDVIEIDGLFTHNDIHTDCTLEGNGSEENPLRISDDVFSSITESIEKASTDLREDVEELKETVNELDAALSTEISERKDGDAIIMDALSMAEDKLITAIANEKEERETADADIISDFNGKISVIDDKISALTDTLYSEIENVNNAIEQEHEERVSADSELATSIEAEANAREEKDNELLEAILNETAARESGDTVLQQAIEEEYEERVSADTQILEALNEEVENRISADEELSEAISAVSDSVVELEDAIAIQLDGIRENVSENRDLINAETSARTEAIEELEQKLSGETEERIQSDNNIIERIESAVTEITILNDTVKDVVTTEDIPLSEKSPLYDLLNGRWDNDIVPSGTTLTEFVKTLFGEDKRMYYARTTNEPLSYYIKGRNVRYLDSFTSGEIGTALDSGFTIDILNGTDTCIILLPRDRELVSVIEPTAADVNVTDLFTRFEYTVYITVNGKKQRYVCYSYTTAAKTLTESYYKVEIA